MNTNDHLGDSLKIAKTVGRRLNAPGHLGQPTVSVIDAGIRCHSGTRRGTGRWKQLSGLKIQAAFNARFLHRTPIPIASRKRDALKIYNEREAHRKCNTTREFCSRLLRIYVGTDSRDNYDDDS